MIIHSRLTNLMTGDYTDFILDLNSITPETKFKLDTKEGFFEIHSKIVKDE